MNLQQYLAPVPDWPKPGVTFLDISPILADPALYLRAVGLIDRVLLGTDVTSIVAIESRGFVFAAAEAARMQKPLILCRKAGKLPGATHDIRYDTEYSQDILSIQQTAKPGDRPLIIDDILATGGTVCAVAELLRSQFEARAVHACTLFELGFLDGRQRLRDANIHYKCVEIIQPGN